MVNFLRHRCSPSLFAALIEISCVLILLHWHYFLFSFPVNICCLVHWFWWFNVLAVLHRNVYLHKSILEHSYLPLLLTLGNEQALTEWEYIPPVGPRPVKGFVGLKNAGATCYMNSVTQQVSYSTVWLFFYFNSYKSYKITCESEIQVVSLNLRQ